MTKLTVTKLTVSCTQTMWSSTVYTELRYAGDSYCFQDCLDHMYQWSVTRQLQISSQKCCVVDVSKSTAADDGYPCCLGNERLTVSENVRDLGVVVDSHLCFSEHIANIVRKAHQRANLIHRCFTSKNPDLLVKAFKVHVRPILEFNSPVWSPSLLKDILVVESVQRKFTKRISSMPGLSYYSRLQTGVDKGATTITLGPRPPSSKIRPCMLR